MGRAEDIFSEIVNSGEIAIDRFISDFHSENLWLDFKRSSDSGSGVKLSTSDRENLAKAISGFGNSDGGVVVWGVDCRRDPKTGADLPGAKHPISNPERFVSWLENAVSSCVTPPHAGVEHVAVKRQGASDGFVATLITQSIHAPHQCIQPTTDLRYYMRAGSSFSAVPHAILAGLFGRRPQPRVAVKWLALPLQRNNQDMITLSAAISLTNSGRSIARDMYLNMWAYPPGPKCRITFGQVGERWEMYSLLNIWNVIAQEGYRVAPGAPAPVGVFELSLLPPFDHTFSLDIAVGCEGSERRQDRTEIPATRVLDLYKQALHITTSNTPADPIYAAFLRGA